MTVQLTNTQFEAALRQSQRAKGQRPRVAAEEAADLAIAGVRIDYSGLDVNRMWHSGGGTKRVGMEFVESLDRALPEWTDSSKPTSMGLLMPTDTDLARFRSATDCRSWRGGLIARSFVDDSAPPIVWRQSLLRIYSSTIRQSVHCAFCFIALPAFSAVLLCLGRHPQSLLPYQQLLP